jgi:hypothetical protein
MCTAASIALHFGVLERNYSLDVLTNKSEYFSSPKGSIQAACVSDRARFNASAFYWHAIETFRGWEDVGDAELHAQCGGRWLSHPVALVTRDESQNLFHQMTVRSFVRACVRARALCACAVRVLCLCVCSVPVACAGLFQHILGGGAGAIRDRPDADRADGRPPVGKV